MPGWAWFLVGFVCGLPAGWFGIAAVFTVWIRNHP